MFLPARDSSIPELVEEEDLPLANGLVLGSSYGTIPLGAGLFAAVAALPFADLFGRPFALVFWIDAFTFLVSFVFIARLSMLAADDSDGANEDVRFLDAFRIPLVRAVMPAAFAVALGLGALFSLGIVFVREVLERVRRGVRRAHRTLRRRCRAGTRCAPAAARPRPAPRDSARCGSDRRHRRAVQPRDVGVARLRRRGGVRRRCCLRAVVGDGRAPVASSTGQQRVLAFAAFHVVIRIGLSLAAVGAGLAGDLLGDVQWPWVGELEPSRVVLLCSGLVVVLSSALVRLRESPGSEKEPPEP